MKRTPPPRKALDGIEPYMEHTTAPLNLSDNTPLHDPSPAIAEALASFPPERMRSYPPLYSEKFRDVAARVHNVRPGMVVTGNGSNDMIDLCIRAFADPGDTVAWHPPSFDMIAVFARAAGCQAKAVPLRSPGFQLDVDGMLAAKAKVTFVCRPNNPTGNAFDRALVERIARESPGLVVVDEAYGDYHEDSFLGLTKELPNLAVLRTLSKAQGLAALRIGYAVAQEPVANALVKARGPFRLNTLSEHVGIRVLERDDWTRKAVEETRRERGRLELELRTRAFGVQPSDANFVLFKPTVDAWRLHEALLRRGVAVRRFSSPELRPWLRATVGPAWVTQRFLAELDDALREVGPRR